jgi:hypothetical protein
MIESIYKPLPRVGPRGVAISAGVGLMAIVAPHAGDMTLEDMFENRSGIPFGGRIEDSYQEYTGGAKVPVLETEDVKIYFQPERGFYTKLNPDL